MRSSMPGRIGISVAALLLLWTTACTAPSQTLSPGTDAFETTTDVEFEVITEVRQGDVFGGFDAQRLVIRDETEWNDYYDSLNATLFPPPESPRIDFDQRMVIAAELGSRPTGGHSIRVDSIVEDETSLHVRVTSTAPGSGCMVTLSLSAPVTAITLARTDKTVVFDDTSNTRDCR
ncbi:MAG: protease complex subunit PrcB family protein [bacterium]|nr:protease complex subunit PrcB family protein [bacterium]